MLTILAAIGLTTTTASSVVACNGNQPSPSIPKIELQINSLTVIINETTNIVISNYEQIKGSFENFTLRILNQDPNNKEEILKQVGDFDATIGQFKVQGLKKGPVNVTVWALLKDQNLGHSSTSATLTITVIPQTEFFPIAAEKTEILAGDLDEISIDNYQEISQKWTNFTLHIVNQDPNSKEKILSEYADFDEINGKFKIVGLQLGKAKVTISALLKEETNNQIFEISRKNFTSKEITINVKKMEIGKEMFPHFSYWEAEIGYGITGQEAKEIVEKEIMNQNACARLTLEYGKDYEISNLDLNKTFKKDDEIHIQALENSKVIEGEGTIRFIKCDIHKIGQTLQTVPVGTTESKIRDLVQKETDKIIKGTGFDDYAIFGKASKIGVSINVIATINSEKIAGKFYIKVVAK